MQLNLMGIQINNNQSRIVNNNIEKCHENGIRIVGSDKSQVCKPVCWRNHIKTCGHNGIECKGEQCEPDIRGNIIEQNRKAGIKLTEKSNAVIGGSTKEDIKFIPSISRDQASNKTFQTAKKEAEKVYKNAKFEGNGQILEDDEEEPSPTREDEIEDYGPGPSKQPAEPSIGMSRKSFPNPNVIQQNFNQGILVVEGSYARITSNKIDANIKANIALGGEKTGMTRIKYNYIENSKSEGIFVAEGEANLIIEDNQIERNSDGIVLINSDGMVRYN